MNRPNWENIKKENLKINIENNSMIVDGIFIDLDGTLLDNAFKRISKKNVEAIKRQQKICPIVVSTGRSYSKKVKKIMEQLDIEYAICQNGAVIADKNGNILKNITLNKEQVNTVVNIVKEKKRGFTINSEFLIYSDHWFWTTLTVLWRKKWKRINKYQFKENSVNKIVVVGYLNTKKIWNLSKLIDQKIKNASVKTSGRDKIIEITNEKATKGEAAQFLASKLNIDIHKCIHIGDSENDSTTLGKVGALIAMKDGSSKLLNLATHIGPKHKRAGVAKVLSGDIKINEIKDAKLDNKHN